MKTYNNLFYTKPLFHILGESKNQAATYPIYDKYNIDNRVFFMAKINILRKDLRKMIFANTAMFYDNKTEDFYWRGWNGEKLQNVFRLNLKDSSASTV